MTAFILAAEVISSLSLASELSLEPFLQDDFDGNNGSSSWTQFFFVRFRHEQQEIDIEIGEGSLEVKLPTIWTDEKQSRAEAEEKRKIRREKIRRERVRRKKMQMREKVAKSRNTAFFQ